MKTYFIELNGSFIKECRSLKTAIKWVAERIKSDRVDRRGDGDGIRIWESLNQCRECLISNYG